MHFKWPRETIVYIIAACTVFACATGSTSPSGGGEDGEGGDSWGGQGPSSSASGSSSSGSSGSSGSGGVTTCDMQSADCSTCSSCSRETADGKCGSQYDDCLANSDCVAFATCFSNCPDGDTLCFSDCESFYPVGVSLFDIYATCVICTDCYVKCDGATATCN